MATIADANNTASNLRQMLAAIVRPRTSFTRDELVGFSFKSVEHEIGLIMKACDDLYSSNLESLSVTQLSQLQQRVKQLADLLNPLLAFDPLQDGQNPKERHRQMCVRLTDSSNDAIKDIAAAVCYSGRGAADKLEAEARVTIQATKESLDKSLQQISAAQKDADRMMQAIKDASGKSTVSIHTDLFESQSQEHLTASNGWLKLFVLCTIGGLVLIWLFFIGPLKPQIDSGVIVAEAIYNVTSRLLFFSIISFAIYWAARNYFSHRHNYIVNKHRQNALATFQTFVNAPVDAQIKDTVLLQAAQTIFSAQQTGYVENEPIPTLVSGAEIIRATLTSKS